MCSTREARLASLRAAIDEVALAAQTDRGEHADLGELAARLASLWAMIAELDPGLAARLRGYCPDISLGTRSRSACGSQPLTARAAGLEATLRGRRRMPSCAAQPTATGAVGVRSSGPRTESRAKAQTPTASS